jgi:hypothetical protein
VGKEREAADKKRADSALAEFPVILTVVFVEKKQMSKLYLVASMILAGLCLPALAQVEQGVILGTVSDQSGARIVGATVTMTNLGTNVSQVASTGEAGGFRSTPLRSGRYSISVEAPGFKRLVRTGITLEIQAEVQLDLTLELGATADQVTITADAALLQTTEASRGQVIDNKKIVDLPLNGRDYLQLALLTAGTNMPPPGARFGGFSAGGFRVSQNNYLLDGMDNNSNQHAAQGRTAQVISPSVDAIQEFKFKPPTTPPSSAATLAASLTLSSNPAAMISTAARSNSSATKPSTHGTSSRSPAPIFLSSAAISSEPCWAAPS